ncbi:MAG: sugar transporter [Paracoccaceae bacterium]
MADTPANAAAREEELQLPKRARRLHAHAPQPKPARARARHYLLLASFVLCVLCPIAASAWYLWGRALDQYASSAGFTVRQEEAGSALELLGGLSSIASTGSSDTDMLYAFIQSQQLVARIDQRFDLRAHYSAGHDTDPVFALAPDGALEDLVAYWRRIVQVSYDPGTALIELRVLAFEPSLAREIARAILDESATLINQLSAVAREDATAYARRDLDAALTRLRAAREAITNFRSRTQIVDPSTVLEGQVGILANLQQQMATTLIELDMLRDATRANDPRILLAERKVAVIGARIDEERAKFSSSGAAEGSENYAALVSEFERLTVDREYAEARFTAAQAAFDVARAEADRKTRYLATFVQPTLAETAQHPQRVVILGLLSLFVLLGWSILTLIYYALRDRT